VGNYTPERVADYEQAAIGPHYPAQRLGGGGTLPFKGRVRRLLPE
jgi:hypothetical protein